MTSRPKKHWKQLRIEGNDIMKKFLSIIAVMVIIMTFTGAAYLDEENSSNVTGTYLSSKGYLIILSDNGKGSLVYLPYLSVDETFNDPRLKITWSESNGQLSIIYESSKITVVSQPDGTYISSEENADLFETMRKLSDSTTATGSISDYRTHFKNMFGRGDRNGSDIRTYAPLVKSPLILEFEIPSYYNDMDDLGFLCEITDSENFAYITAEMSVNEYVPEQTFVKAARALFESGNNRIGDIEEFNLYGNHSVVAKTQTTVNDMNYTVCTAYVRDRYFGWVLKIDLY